MSLRSAGIDGAKVRALQEQLARSRKYTVPASVETRWSSGIVTSTDGRS
jgi:hypothetical protein